MLLRWLLILVRQGALKPDQTGRSGVTYFRDPDKGPVFKAVEDCCCSLLRYFQVLHKNGLWLNRDQCNAAADAVHLFCAGYCFLAGNFLERQLCLFHLEPSLHMFKHIGLRLTRCLQTSAPVVLSPAAFLCDMSEDFVGICARISRRVAARTCGQRTLQRMLIRAYLEFEKQGL